MFDFLLDYWQFGWFYAKGKENGVAKYEEYEKKSTVEQFNNAIKRK